MAAFFHINKEVLPLKANLAVAEAKLEKANAELAEAQGKLDVAQLTAQKLKNFDSIILLNSNVGGVEYWLRWQGVSVRT